MPGWAARYATHGHYVDHLSSSVVSRKYIDLLESSGIPREELRTDSGWKLIAREDAARPLRAIT